MRGRGRVTQVPPPPGGMIGTEGDVVSGPEGLPTIPANTVTFGQLEDLAASSLIGRGSEFGAGDPERIDASVGDVRMVGRMLRLNFYMSPLTTGGDPAAAELIFNPSGDVIDVPVYF